MKRPLPILHGADWNEAIGTGNVSVDIPKVHLEAGVFEVAVGSKVFVMEDEEQLGVEGTVIEIIKPSKWNESHIAVVKITEN